MAFANYLDDEDQYSDPEGEYVPNVPGPTGPPPAQSFPYPGYPGYPPGFPGAPAPAAETPAPAPTPTGGGGVRGGGGGGPDFSFPGYNFGPVPEFKYDPFTVPTFEDAQNEPGYQFRQKAGTDALERSAAAKGVLRTGGTLKDLVAYGQNFGAQEYSNVFNRALQGYQAKYQGQKDAFAPRMAAWQNAAQAERARALAMFQANVQKSLANSGGGGGGTNWGALYGSLGNEPQFPF